MELWLHAFSFPGRVAELGRQAEDWGFTGLMVADSQNLTGDIWVELGLAGAATSRLRLGPGVTNPITRHLAVTASAAATLQAETRGRAMLGFAQGDSALSQIGRKRLSVSDFERSLQALQGLLRGQQVLLDGGARSTIHWLSASQLDKVPVHVAATGARTIQAAARHAEGVDLTVGAEPGRLREGVAIAREAAAAPLTLGAYVNVAVDSDRRRARDLVRGSVATFARFSSAPTVLDGLPEVTRRGVETAAGRYEQDRHGQASAGSARRLDDAFVDRFAVAGPAGYVGERLAQIQDCGIERLIVVPGSLDADPVAVDHSNQRLSLEVLPELNVSPGG
jgi:5,10-methylenetetrahydromethanopterin reductase